MTAVRKGRNLSQGRTDSQSPISCTCHHRHDNSLFGHYLHRDSCCGNHHPGIDFLTCKHLKINPEANPLHSTDIDQSSKEQRDCLSSPNKSVVTASSPIAQPKALPLPALFTPTPPFSCLLGASHIPPGLSRDRLPTASHPWRPVYSSSSWEPLTYAYRRTHHRGFSVSWGSLKTREPFAFHRKHSAVVELQAPRLELRGCWGRSGPAHSALPGRAAALVGGVAGLGTPATWTPTPLRWVPFLTFITSLLPSRILYPPLERQPESLFFPNSSVRLLRPEAIKYVRISKQEVAVA